jgi:uncharacterized protein YjbI with pentapeptide repeats
MANEEQLTILKQGVDVWNRWRIANPNSRIDLTNVILNKAELSGANLLKADLRETNLRESNLSRANLCEADLRLADLARADLREVDLSEADLREVNLVGAQLVGSILREADLSDADFSVVNLTDAFLGGADLIRTNLNEANLAGARFYGADLWGAKVLRSNFKGAEFGYTGIGENDLSNAIGLEEVHHLNHSTIGIDTILLSKGKIPVAFLRGCGLRDLDIEYAKLAAPGLDSEQVTEITYKIHQLYLGGGIQYYSCFISYSSKDEAFARQLHDDLQNNGVRCWFAPEDLKIGDQIRPRIDQEIRLRDKLLVVLSENSVKSEWVGDEVEAALEEESKSNGLVLFPIRLDNAVMNTRDDWAAKIRRRRHIGDFSNWKDKASYQKAFERLLRDLKATEDRP